MRKAPIGLQDPRRRLYVKAKTEPSWRFWGLYVHMCQPETLQAAYRLARENDGAPGIDGVTFEAIEAQVPEGILGQLREELVQRTYRPLRVRKVEIPKAGGTRQLSIPTIRDRVVQGALKLILEPIFEADFQPGLFGYRPKKAAHDAIQCVSRAILTGKTHVIDLDLRAYFDSVRHHSVLEKVAKRVNDDEVLCLLKRVLEATGKRGVPQGGVISPLLSNLYLNEVDKMLEKAQEVTWYRELAMLEYARFADDLVVLVSAHARQLSTLPFGRWYSPKTGRPYLGARPSARSIRKVCRAISERTSRQWLLKDPQDRVEALNPLLRGWANYFALGTVNPAYRAVDRHVKRRLRQWLCGKRKGSGRGFTRFPDEYLYHVLGIKNLPVRPHSVL
jgi:RNA-directed DNA polymerase